MTRRRHILFGIVGPGLVWAAHFIVVYALISAACAARGLISFQSAQNWSAVLTAIACALCLSTVILRPRAAGHDMARAALWSGLIFALAVIVNAGAFMFLNSCGG